MTTNDDATSDPFFGGLDETEWNACIGRQATEENYVDGYLEAAVELASAVIDKGLHGQRDTLAMPILYNARHGLELALKHAINQLVAIGMLPAGHAVDHDVLSHWRLLDKAKLGDVAMRELVAALKPFVTSLAQIDDDGQALRYPEGRDGKKSLQDRSLANIARMRESVTAMREVLERLKHRVMDLCDERRTGSFTAECSRKDLIDLADMLPPVAEWKEPHFLAAKSAAMERFGLGSRKFSAAVAVIKKSREMRRRIGQTTDLAHLSDEHALFAMEQWTLCHPEPAPSEGLGVSYFGDRDFDAMAKRHEVLGRSIAAIMETLSVDEIADLEAIYLVGRGREFCEAYADILGRARGQHCMDNHLWEAVHHLVTKTNLQHAVARGLVILGRPDLSGKVAAVARSKAETLVTAS